jgi:hypothetical protein
LASSSKGPALQEKVSLFDFPSMETYRDRLVTDSYCCVVLVVASSLSALVDMLDIYGVRSMHSTSVDDRPKISGGTLAGLRSICLLFTSYSVGVHT